MLAELSKKEGVVGCEGFGPQTCDSHVAGPTI